MSELQLELDFIEQLKNLGYEYVPTITDELSIKNNFRSKLGQLNKFELTDEHFIAIMLYLEKGSIFDKAVNIRDGFDLKLEDGTIKTIYFLDQTDWCHNIFQVINQFKLSGAVNNRFDVSILVNGLPLVHVELKKSTVSIREAFGQIDRYKRETMDRSFFYQFVQLFVMSNGNSTRYVANNQKINNLFAFKFVDFENNPINDLTNFTFHFLERCRLGKFLSKYVILSNGNNDEMLMLMRPYQVNAVEGILNKLDNRANGYVWHTTGSGKTLTSFKACEIISERDDVDKVIFVVDRIDLDRQTVSEYQKFKKKDASDIVTISSVKDLDVALGDPSFKIIVTTIQKLDYICKGSSVNSDLSVVLVFDECHRGQLGDTHQRISKYFNNPCKYGFTGTPIFKDNRSTTDGELQTTASVFGDRVHTYTIADAIADKNVLGFKIDYKDVITKGTTNISQGAIGKDSDNREIFMSDGYIRTVATDVIDTYDTYTNNRKYNAMLACDGIQAAIKYYRFFKKGTFVVEQDYEVVNKPHSLRVACVFSVNENEVLKGNKESSKDAMLKIMSDYNEMFKDDPNPPNFDYSTIKQYRADVERRMKRREIDLLIVSDMFLTGFDAKFLNTLYLDKDQKYHTLIQTLSRTNRIESHSKNYGNITCYRRIEENVKDAVGLFSNNNPIESVIPPSYQEQLDVLVKVVASLQESFPDFETVENMKGDVQKFDFVKKMRDVNRVLNATKQYREFTYGDLPISRLTLEEFDAKYVEIYEEINVRGDNNLVSILDEIDFEISLIDRVVINYDYIKYHLLAGLDTVARDSEEYESSIKDIIEKVQKDPVLRTKFELIRDFLDKFTGDRKVSDEFDDYTEHLNTIKLEGFCEEHNLDVDSLTRVRDQYVNGKTLIQLSDDINKLVVKPEGYTFIKWRLFLKEKCDLVKMFLVEYHNDIFGS